MGDNGQLTDFEIELYRALLASPGRSLADIAADRATPAEDLDKPAAVLVEHGLARRIREDVFLPVSPMLAEAIVLGAEDLELGARRAAVESRRNAIRSLVPDWNIAYTAPEGEAVDVVFDQAAIANVLMHYADRCQSELLSVAPGRLPASRIDGRTRIANMYGLRRGIRTRALYQHTALRDRATRSYLTELADNGAKDRFAPSVPGRSLVVDQEVALLPIPTPPDPSQPGLAIVREPNVIAWVVATFEQLWAEAVPLEDIVDHQRDETELDQTRAAIVRLMAEGEKDEAISRRLSISVRTCRRHIAEYMTQVGAASRFQAGVIAARAGHTDTPLPP